MQLRYRVHLEPVPQPWLEALVAEGFEAVRRFPFAGGALTFGRDRPVVQVGLTGDAAHLDPGSRYACSTNGLLDVAPSPFGYVTVGSWEPSGTTSISAVAANLVKTADFANGHVDFERDSGSGVGELSVHASYLAESPHPRAESLLQVFGEASLDLTGWWSGKGGKAPLRALASHAFGSMHLEVAHPVRTEDGWDVTFTIEIQSRWWARPLLLLALEYVQYLLRHRYQRTLDRISTAPGEGQRPQGLTARKLDRAVQVFVAAWNETVPELTAQSPTQLAREKVAGLVFRGG